MAVLESRAENYRISEVLALTFPDPWLDKFFDAPRDSGISEPCLDRSVDLPSYDSALAILSSDKGAGKTMNALYQMSKRFDRFNHIIFGENNRLELIHRDGETDSFERMDVTLDEVLQITDEPTIYDDFHYMLEYMTMSEQRKLGKLIKHAVKNSENSASILVTDADMWDKFNDANLRYETDKDVELEFALAQVGVSLPDSNDFHNPTYYPPGTRLIDTRHGKLSWMKQRSKPRKFHIRHLDKNLIASMHYGDLHDILSSKKVRKGENGRMAFYLKDIDICSPSRPWPKATWNYEKDPIILESPEEQKKTGLSHEQLEEMRTFWSGMGVGIHVERTRSKFFKVPRDIVNLFNHIIDKRIYSFDVLDSLIPEDVDSSLSSNDRRFEYFKGVLGYELQE
jgi:hypothetical protein